MPNYLRHGADYETLIPLSSFDFTVSLAGQMSDGLWPCGFKAKINSNKLSNLFVVG